MKLALTQSLVDAERTTNQGFIEANQDLINKLKDAKVPAKEKELHQVQINLALEIANQRRKDAEEIQEKYLINPTLEASTSNQVQNLQGQVVDLRMKLIVEKL